MKNILLACILAAACITAKGQAGSLDQSFGNLGIVRNDFGPANVYGNFCKQMLLHPDGSFFLVFGLNGQAFITHRFPDGSIDTGYGENGYSVPVWMSNPVAVLQPDGKIVVGGTAIIHNSSDFALARFNTTGLLDNSFSVDGVQLTDFFSGTDKMNAITLQADGKIVAGGSATTSTGATDFALARFTPDGSLDNSFSGDGKQTTDFAGFGTINGLAMKNDGRILALGGPGLAVLSYNADGSPDNTFGWQGKKTIDQCVGKAILVQPDGKILVAGFITNQTPLGRDDDFVVVRLNNNGESDGDFSGDGIASYQFYTRDESATCLAIQTNGRILVGGYTTARPSYSDFAVVQYNADGTVYGAFNTDIAGGGDYLYSLAVQADSKILAAGISYYFFPGSGNANYSVVRYNENGSLDNTMDGDGRMMDYKPNGLGGYSASALQADGKLVTAGTVLNGGVFNAVIARYNTDGTPDNSFSNDGSLTTSLGSYNSDEVIGVVIQGDGKIVIAGRTDFAVMRLNADGTTDNTFSGDGKVQTNLGSAFDRAEALSIQPDGKIVIAGHTFIQYTPSAGRDEFAVVRYNSDGTLDNSFSDDGKLITPFGQFNAIATSVVVQPDGKIITAGIYNIYGNTDFALARYNPDGTLDQSFDDDGMITTDINNRDWIASIALQPEGKIVVSGYSYSLEGWKDLLIVRYNTDGSPDNSFSEDGKLVYDIGFKTETATSMSLQPNGKIIVGGYATGENNEDFIMVRFNREGTIDNSFASGGKLIMDFGFGNDRIESLNLWNERLYVVGASVYGGQVGIVAAYSTGSTACNINIAIPDATTLDKGVQPNTVYTGYVPASDLTLSAQVSDGIAPYTYKWSNGAITPSITIMPTAGTTFTVSVTDAAGCTETVSRYVNVVDVRCGNKLDKVLICRVPPGNPLNASANCVSANAVAALLTNGAYLGNCNQELLTSSRILSEQLQKNGAGLVVYSNPTNTYFKMKFSSSEPGIVNLVIWDVAGRAVEKRIAGANQIIEVGAEYSPGIYFIEVTQALHPIVLYVPGD